MQQIIQSFKNGELWLAEVPAPICKHGGVLVQTRNSFVSAGTERMLVDFAKKNIVGKALAMPDQVKKVLRKMKTEGIFETLEKVKSKLDQPIPLGYSCAGVVEEVGAGVAGIAIGDRVACGGAGYANHAEYNFVPKNLLAKIPEAVSFEDASCATVGSIAMQGVRQCDLRLGETVCVIGLGLLGILAVQMLKASGCLVIGFDPNQQRCQLAMELGADLAISDNIEAACLEFSNGFGVDATLITAATKSNAPVRNAGEITRMKGKVVVTGMIGMDLPRDQYYKKELDFKLSLSYGPGRYDPNYEEAGNDYPFGYVRWTEQRNIKAFLDLVAAGKVTPGKLITHRFDINDALDAYKLMLGKIDEPYLGIVLNYKEKEPGKFERKISNNTSYAAVKGSPGIGFIGCGNFAKSVLIPQLKKHNTQLLGLCTATGMNCSETAKKEKFSYATTDYTELLQDTAVNTVFIATRHNSHAKFIAEALQAGKNVFVEKPLAINENQLTDLLACREQYSKGIVTIGFNRRFSPYAKIIKDHFVNRRTPMFVNYRVNAGIISPDVWIQDSEVGGGRIIGESVHFIDFASYLIGCDVVEVQASCTECDNAALIDADNISINLKYADGSIANIVYAAIGSSATGKEYCEVYADESTAIMNDFRNILINGKRKLSGKQDKGFTEELNVFLNAVSTGGESPIAWQSIVNTTKVSFAVMQALANRNSVNI
jgi:predicted dehydrogenase/threonine dehydrogenase-like Zn-dependent dehydrogenase